MRVLASLALTAALSASALAQQQAGTAAAPMPAALKSFTSKFFVTGALNGSAIRVAGSSTTENGGGASLGLGYGFSPNLAAYVEGTGARIGSSDASGDYNLGHFDLGVRYHFANVGRQWIPFLDAAFTGRAAMWKDVTICAPGCQTNDMSMSGTGFSFGGGVMYYASPKLAISANLKWTAGKFDEVKYGNTTTSGLDQDATTSRFGVGMVWFPAAH